MNKEFLTLMAKLSLWYDKFLMFMVKAIGVLTIISILAIIIFGIEPN